MANNIKIKGLNELQRKLNGMSRKLKSYDGTHNISLPFTQEQWDRMTKAEQNIHIENAKNNFINQMVKDVFN